MDKCVLFTKDLDENGCICLKISQDGIIITPPAKRSFAEINIIQDESETLIVESCAHASILLLEFPWLSERKARTALPFALEDKVAQPIDELHFAFDKQNYQNGHYTVAVIGVQRMHYLMHILNEQEIDFDAITLDWFALSPQELVVNENILLVNQEDFKGALSDELAESYIKTHPLNEALLFSDSELKSDLSTTKNTLCSYTWIAQKIIQAKPLNLCQGSLQHGTASDWIKKGYQLAGVLASVWLVTVLLVNALSLYSLNKQTAKIDQQIATIYYEFFPDAKQVISPKFRMGQILGENAANGPARFWFLVNQFANAMQSNPLIVEQLRFQNKTLSVTLTSSDFAALEELENQLKTLQLKVKQTQASTHDQHVVATLELM